MLSVVLILARVWVDVSQALNVTAIVQCTEDKTPLFAPATTIAAHAQDCDYFLRHVLKLEDRYNIFLDFRSATQEGLALRTKDNNEETHWIPEELLASRRCLSFSIGESQGKLSNCLLL